MATTGYLIMRYRWRTSFWTSRVAKRRRRGSSTALVKLVNRHSMSALLFFHSKKTFFFWTLSFVYQKTIFLWVNKSIEQMLMYGMDGWRPPQDVWDQGQTPGLARTLWAILTCGRPTRGQHETNISWSIEYGNGEKPSWTRSFRP